MQMPLGYKTLTLFALWTFPLVAAPQALAQDDEWESEEDDEYDDDLEEEEFVEEESDSATAEDTWEQDRKKKSRIDEPSPEQAKAIEEEEIQGDFDAVIATDREPRDGTPLIANKRYPMGFRFELSAVADIGYSKALTSQYGGHGAFTLHIFDWLALEAFGGLSYPQESQITEAVRLDGFTFRETGISDPVLSDLWQSFAIGGADVQWAPLYGKLSFVAEQDLSFQLYFTGGAAIEGIAKPLEVANDLNAERDFWMGLINGKPFNYSVRPSVAYGAGIRLIPWEFFAIRLEARNFTGIQPAVTDTSGNPVKKIPILGQDSVFEVTTLPTIQIGLSLLI